MSVQLPLGLQLRESARFDNFLSGPNAGAVAAARACAAGDEPALLYLWGAPASGRTHLLQAACHQAAAHGLSIAYVPLHGEAALLPSMLQGLEQAQLVCIDDLDRAAGDAQWERALFGLVNGVLEQHGRLMVSATAPPAESGLELADLQSRLSLSAVFALQRLNDADKLALLKARARARGMELGDEAGNYLLRHTRRDLPALLALLDQLDRESLAAQRRLTVPFVREVLTRGQ